MGSVVERNVSEYMEISWLEQWRDIEWYMWYYQCSNLWRVRSVDREVIVSKIVRRHDPSLDMDLLIKKDNNYKFTWKIVLPQESSNGYLKVVLCMDGKRKSYSLWKLIFCTFSEYWLDDFNWHVHHINWYKRDNRLSNLLWLYKEECDIAKVIFSNIKWKWISLDDIYDMLYKLRSRTWVNETTPWKKALDTEWFILDFVEEKNKWIEDDYDMSWVWDFSLLEFFTWIQKKKVD